MRAELVHRLSEIVVTEADSVIPEVLKCISTVAPLRIASNWRFNARTRTVTVETRLSYLPDPADRREFAHPITDGLLGWAHREIERNKLKFLRIPDLQAPSIISIHLSAEQIKKLDLHRLICIPYYNLVADATEADSPAGFVNLYPEDQVELSDEELLFIQSRLNQLETMHFLRAKDLLASRVISIFSEFGSARQGKLLDEVIRNVCMQFFPVEASSIYEVSTQKNVFSVAATTGLDQNQANKAGFDFKGAGLVGEVVKLGRAIVLQDINNVAEVEEELGVTKTREEILMNMETLKSPPQSLLLVPIYNPATQPAEGMPIGILRLVNKRCRSAPYSDFFSTLDVSLATELARLLAFYEDHKRLERGRLAFALHFGHEAQAPAVGIKGTAERLIRHFDDETLPRAMRLSLLSDIRDFSDLLLSFSDSVTFGFADRTQSFKSRYRVRKGSLREAIEQAKKVVTPICRKENIPFDKIRIFGSYPEIFLDMRAFTQIFYNLFSNAIKYRSRDEGADFSVIVTCAKGDFTEVLSVPSSGTPQRRTIKGYNIEVMDFGIGVPDEYKTKIFAEGYRVPDVGAMEIRGSGIGLSIVRNILQDFQCVINLTKINSPTTFKIFLPDKLESREYMNDLMSRGAVGGLS